MPQHFHELIHDMVVFLLLQVQEQVSAMHVPDYPSRHTGPPRAPVAAQLQLQDGHAYLHCRFRPHFLAARLDLVPQDHQDIRTEHPPQVVATVLPVDDLEGQRDD